jgi:UDP-3-O-[3-hydroxymyristoyl] N-acetylglucosamine deacetylase
LRQQTLARAFSFEGVGIHTGVMARVTVHPAPAGTGRVFQVGETLIPARTEFVVDTRRCTTLGNESARLHTVEHLLSALHGFQIDNARIVVEGPEIPILDGSALPYISLIRQAGCESQDAPPHLVRLNTVLRGADLREPSGEIEMSPADRFVAEVTVEFADWPEGAARVAATIGEDDGADYATHVAPARTFAFRKEVEALLAAGLAKGGSLDNALIITPPDTFSTALRLPVEWAVHKLLDLIGDFALLDARPLLRVTAHKPGHRSNTLAADAVRRLSQSPA